MELLFTGLGAAYYPVLGSNCAFFVHNDQLYMIDCGESTFCKMFSREEMFRYEKITVLLTHLHADHIGSLGSFLSFCKNVLHKSVRLIAQDDTVVRILSMSGVQPDMYTFSTDFSICSDGDLSIQPQKVQHANDMLCCGFIITCDGVKTYYGGDSAAIPENILAQFLSGDIHSCYQDCTFIDQDSVSHNSLMKLVKLIPESERSRFYCMHFGSDMKDQVLEYGFQIPKVV